ncbi:hypothetical protein PAPYR_2306 [Paratrimastix pyriformis]|uniref:Methyltransferase type 11 domain-containing protein n=1 Tax=Paratrimastix pyriformis TaxID=342808 RepID=A0ABQ8URX0_9EUKA|nr:hypothetical protein PAPYR_2306 [Paratrimastix pyriformis]
MLRWCRSSESSTFPHRWLDIIESAFGPANLSVFLGESLGWVCLRVRVLFHDKNQFDENDRLHDEGILLMADVELGIAPVKATGTQEVSSLAAGFEETKDRLEIACQRIQNEQHAYALENALLKDRLQAAEAQAASATREKDEIRRELESLRGQYLALESAHVQVVEERDDLQARLAGTHEENAQLRGDQDNLIEQMTTHQASIQSALVWLALQAEQMLCQSAAEYSVSQSQLDLLSRQLEVVGQQHQEALNMLKETQTQAALATQQQGQQEAAWAEQRDRDLTAAREARARLEQTLLEQEARLAEVARAHTSEIADLRGSLAEYQRQTEGAMEAQHASYQAALAEATQAQDELQAQLAALQAEVPRAREEGRLEASNSQADARREASRLLAEAQAQAESEHAQALGALRQRCAETVAEQERGLAEALDKAEGALAALRAHHEWECAEMAAQLRVLAQQREQAQMALRDAHSGFAEARADLRRAHEAHVAALEGLLRKQQAALWASAQVAVPAMSVGLLAAVRQLARVQADRAAFAMRSWAERLAAQAMGALALVPLEALPAQPQSIARGCEVAGRWQMEDDRPRTPPAVALAAASKRLWGAVRTAVGAPPALAGDAGTEDTDTDGQAEAEGSQIDEAQAEGEAARVGEVRERAAGGFDDSAMPPVPMPPMPMPMPSADVGAMLESLHSHARAHLQAAMHSAREWEVTLRQQDERHGWAVRWEEAQLATRAALAAIRAQASRRLEDANRAWTILHAEQCLAMAEAQGRVRTLQATLRRARQDAADSGAQVGALAEVLRQQQALIKQQQAQLADRPATATPTPTATPPSPMMAPPLLSSGSSSSPLRPAIGLGHPPRLTASPRTPASLLASAPARTPATPAAAPPLAATPVAPAAPAEAPAPDVGAILPTTPPPPASATATPAPSTPAAPSTIIAPAATTIASSSAAARPTIAPAAPTVDAPQTAGLHHPPESAPSPSTQPQPQPQPQPPQPQPQPGVKEPQTPGGPQGTDEDSSLGGEADQAAGPEAAGSADEEEEWARLAELDELLTAFLFPKSDAAIRELAAPHQPPHQQQPGAAAAADPRHLETELRFTSALLARNHLERLRRLRERRNRKRSGLRTPTPPATARRSPAREQQQHSPATTTTASATPATPAAASAQPLPDPTPSPGTASGPGGELGLLPAAAAARQAAARTPGAEGSQGAAPPPRLLAPLTIPGEDGTRSEGSPSPRSATTPPPRRRDGPQVPVGGGQAPGSGQARRRGEEPPARLPMLRKGSGMAGGLRGTGGQQQPRAAHSPAPTRGAAAEAVQATDRSAAAAAGTLPMAGPPPLQPAITAPPPPSPPAAGPAAARDAWSLALSSARPPPQLQAATGSAEAAEALAAELAQLDVKLAPRDFQQLLAVLVQAMHDQQAAPEAEVPATPSDEDEPQPHALFPSPHPRPRAPRPMPVSPRGGASMGLAMAMGPGMPPVEPPSRPHPAAGPGSVSSSSAGPTQHSAGSPSSRLAAPQRAPPQSLAAGGHGSFLHSASPYLAGWTQASLKRMLAPLPALHHAAPAAPGAAVAASAAAPSPTSGSSPSAGPKASSTSPARPRPAAQGHGQGQGQGAPARASSTQSPHAGPPSPSPLPPAAWSTPPPLHGAMPMPMAMPMTISPVTTPPPQVPMALPMPMPMVMPPALSVPTSPPVGDPQPSADAPGHSRSPAANPAPPPLTAAGTTTPAPREAGPADSGGRGGSVRGRGRGTASHGPGRPAAKGAAAAAPAPAATRHRGPVVLKAVGRVKTSPKKMQKTGHVEMYKQRCHEYDVITRRHDPFGHIYEHLLGLGIFHHNTVVCDLGSGTGRMSRLLGPHVHSIIAYDRAPDMLRYVLERNCPLPTPPPPSSSPLPSPSPPTLPRKLRPCRYCGCSPMAALRQCAAASPSSPPEGTSTPLGCARTELICAENAHIPQRDASADVVIAGWTVSYAVADTYAQGDRARKRAVRAIVREMRRVARPGGALVILETLGCGEQPTRAGSHYYGWLTEWGFARSTFRSDYLFRDSQEAADLMRFFFSAGSCKKFAPLLRPLSPDEQRRLETVKAGAESTSPPPAPLPRAVELPGGQRLVNRPECTCDCHVAERQQERDEAAAPPPVPLLLPETTAMWVLRLPPPAPATPAPAPAPVPAPAAAPNQDQTRRDE